MRQILIPVLLLSLVAGCSSFKIGPHRIDVQQGNALDQENVARLKPGLSRSQVRFLLGTPLVVDPFRSDRWDYVYRYYKAGTLTEQKHIALFFEGDTLARIEGDLPEPVAQPVAAAPESTAPTTPPVRQPAPAAVAQPVPMVPESAAATPVPLQPPAVAAIEQPAEARAGSVAQPTGELRLQADTDVARIQPDVIPAFPQGQSAPAVGEAPAVQALNAWAASWSRRDQDAYLAAYDAAFVPHDGSSRADWEARKRKALGAAKRIEVRIASPAAERASDGSVTVTFKQFYRSDSYRDTALKQVRMVERDGRWLIVEEKTLSAVSGGKP